MSPTVSKKTHNYQLQTNNLPMKGVILAGGKGTRLLPLTKITNKHLLPIYDKPMIFYPLETLKKAGIKEILIVTDGEFLSSFKKLLGLGKDFGIKLNYKIQKSAGGIAHALNLAKSFVGKDSAAVILGDNIFTDNFSNDIKGFKCGAKVFLKKVPDPERFGVPTLRGKKVIKITEKPKKPESNYAVTGLYIYDNRVFEAIKSIEPSKRGELEITDVNNWYIKNKEMGSKIVKKFWSDAGTFESLAKAGKFIRKYAKTNI